jgi:hypothetical protein
MVRSVASFVLSFFGSSFVLEGEGVPVNVVVVFLAGTGGVHFFAALLTTT